MGRQDFCMGFILFEMTVKHLRGDSQKAVGYTSLEFRVEAIQLAIPRIEKVKTPRGIKENTQRSMREKGNKREEKE